MQEGRSSSVPSRKQAESGYFHRAYQIREDLSCAPQTTALTAQVEIFLAKATKRQGFGCQPAEASMCQHWLPCHPRRPGGSSRPLASSGLPLGLLASPILHFGSGP